MRFARIGSVLTGLVLATSGTATPAVAQRPSDEVLLQQALHLEQVEGNLQQAITLYQRILAQHPADRAVDAKAQLHIGLCYESLGQAEARRAYEQVIANYADQRDEVREARAHLAALQPAPVASRGPVARRLLGADDIDENDLIEVAVSPDGRHIAYIREGDTGGLIVRDLATGGEQVVDSGLPREWNSSPVWSPDGRRLAFEHHGPPNWQRAYLQIVDLETRHRATVARTDSAGSPSLYPVDWSRDGRFLLCRTAYGWWPGGLVLVAVRGGAISPVTDSVTPQSKATISPDDRYVAYAAGVPDSAQVYVQPVAGGARRQLTDAVGYNDSPIWSPDGRDIAYARPDGIWLVPMKNGQRSGPPRLAYGLPPNVMGPPGELFSAWTDIGGLYFSLLHKEATAYRLPVDPITGLQRAGAPGRLPFPKNVIRFAWSPDMRQLAFTTAHSSDISIYSADGRVLAAHLVAPHAQPLTPHYPYSVGWIAGGRQVLYGSRDRGGAWLAALDPASGHVQELIAPRAGRSSLSLSADGRRMAYHRRGGIFVADTGMAEGVLVAPDSDRDGHLSHTLEPRISPRGDQVLFSRQSDMQALWVVGHHGNGPRQVGTPLYGMDGAVWDPTERFIAYTGFTDSLWRAPALRVVNVATGAVNVFRLPDPGGPGEVEVTDWSPDGRYLGVVVTQDWFEYWVVQGLQGGGH